MVVVVSEGDKTVFIVHLSLVDASDCPLSGAVYTASYALPAREIEGFVYRIAPGVS